MPGSGDPREGKGYVVILPTFGPFLNFSLCCVVGTPEIAGVIQPSCPNSGHFRFFPHVGQ